MHPLRFGILSFPTVPYAELARRSCEVEALGFDSIWLADDLNIPGYADFEIWTLLAALAGQTTRIRLGSLVTSTAFRHPAFLAAQAITVDHISQGRVDVAIGAGGPPNNYATLGLDHWEAAERRARLEEQVIMLDQLLRGAPITYAGRYYRTASEALPQPRQQPRPRSSSPRTASAACAWPHSMPTAGTPWVASPIPRRAMARRSSSLRP